MKRLHFCILKFVTVSFVAAEAVQMWFVMMSFQHTWLEDVARSNTHKPFVLRILMPAVSRILEFLLPGDARFWLFVLFVLSAVGFFFASKYFFDFFGEGLLTPFLACQVLFVITVAWIKSYDYMTAALFALCLGLLVRGKHGVYLIVFVLATLNRETTILLILFYAVFFYRKMSMQKLAFFVLIQIVIYLSIKIGVEYIFRNTDGKSISFTLHWMASVYSKFWYLFLPVVPVSFLLLKHREKIPEFVRYALVFIFIPQVLLHLLFGMPFEFRVFAESITILVLSMKLLLQESREIYFQARRFSPL